ncbi:hypothetical protein ABMA27_005657 [Loxostege sticticalis]|uniref:RRM domain-containing protein n=1 Tax=Loxostege sticticalis TaxID=481309 RepID=A0ABR3HJX8_LOXSC
MSDHCESRNLSQSPTSKDLPQSPIGESRDRPHSPMEISPIGESRDQNPSPIEESRDQSQPPISASVDLNHPPTHKSKERSRSPNAESRDRSKSTVESTDQSRSVGGSRERSRSPIEKGDTDLFQDDSPTKDGAKCPPKHMQRQGAEPSKDKNGEVGRQMRFMRIFNLALHSIEDIREFLRKHLPAEVFEDIVYVGYTNAVAVRFGSVESCKIAQDALSNVIYDGQPLSIKTKRWPNWVSRSSMEEPPIGESGDRNPPPIEESRDRSQPPISASVDQSKERSRSGNAESRDRSKSTGESRDRSRSIGGSRDRSRSPIEEFGDTDCFQDDLPTNGAKRPSKYMQHQGAAPWKAKNGVDGRQTTILRIFNLPLYSIEDIRKFLREHLPAEVFEDIVYVGHTKAVTVRFGSEESCKVAQDALFNVIYDGKPLYTRTRKWMPFPKEFQQKEDERKKDTAPVFPHKAVYVERPVNSSYNTYGLSAKFLETLNLKMPLRDRICVKNLSESVDKNKLNEVFSHAGTIVRLYHKYEKASAYITYEHPLEAVQAISMFRGQFLYDKPMKVVMDRQPASPQITVPEGLSSFGPGLGPNGEIMKNLPSVADLLPLREELVQLISTAKNMLKNGPAENRPEHVVPNQENNTQSVTEPQNVTNPIGNPLQTLLQGLAQATALAGVNSWSNLGPQIPLAGPANVQPSPVNPQPLNMQLPYNTNPQPLSNTPLPQTANSTSSNTQSTNANSYPLLNSQPATNPLLNQTHLNTVPPPPLNMQPTYNAIAQPSLHMQQPSLNIQQPSVNLQQPSLNMQQPSLNLQQPSVNLQQPSVNLQQPSLNTQPPLNTNMQASLNMQLPYNSHSALPTQPLNANTQPSFTTNSLPYSVNSQESTYSKQQPGFSSSHTRLGDDTKGSHKIKEIREAYVSSKRKESEDKRKPSDMLMFSHLPSSVTHKALKSKMSEVGDLKFLEMTGAGKAIVCFEKARDAERCIRLFDHSRVDGKTIEVKFV